MTASEKFKKCAKCGPRPICMFSLRGDRRGLNSYCRSCQRAYSAGRRRAKRAEELERLGSSDRTLRRHKRLAIHEEAEKKIKSALYYARTGGVYIARREDGGIAIGIHQPDGDLVGYYVGKPGDVEKLIREDLA